MANLPSILSTFLVVVFLFASQVLPSDAPPATRCPGYRASDVTQDDVSFKATLTLAGPCNLYGPDIDKLRLLVEYQTEDRLRVLIEDFDANAYHVQETALPREHLKCGNPKATSKLLFSLTDNPFSFNITRAETGDVLFDTSSAPLIFEAQFLQLRTSLPSDCNLYGLGEHSDSFRLPTQSYTRTLWNAESPYIPRDSNLYGSHPVYFDHRGESGTHGVFLASSAGMDINIGTRQLDTPLGSTEQWLEYSAIGGVFDFYFLAGPTPVQVSQQYATVAGLPALVPYWSLGFSQSKYGYKNLDTLKSVARNYSQASIPLESLWSDIDSMDEHRSFTTDPQLFPMDKMKAFVADLHAGNQHYVAILDPGISRTTGYMYLPYNHGVEQDAFIKNADGSLHLGGQWAGESVWPDWFAPGAGAWWNSEVQAFFDPTSGVNVDGLWVDMNEAANLCDLSCLALHPGQPTAVLGSLSSNASSFNVSSFNTKSSFNASGSLSTSTSPSGLRKGLEGRNLLTPPYEIRNHLGALWRSTLATNLTNADGTTQYDTHNLYGHLMAKQTRAALLARSPGKRPFVLSRSTFSGTGAHAAHWFGDNNSTWSDYLLSIRQMLSFSALHAMPMVGSDICGFNGEAEAELCSRWVMLGAFQPFYRNHADIKSPSQELYLWNSVLWAARKAIAMRYRLLDYVYTAMAKASRDGTPVAKPLWFAWPGDKETFAIENQWLWGDALLVSPVTGQGQDTVRAYLPTTEVFYDLWTMKRVYQEIGGWTFFTGLDWDDIPVHIRGGSILPLRVESANTTAEVRMENFELIIAPSRDNKAVGSLYLDDGETIDGASSEIDFVWDGKTLKATGSFGFDTGLLVEKVTVLKMDNSGSTETIGPWGLTSGFSVEIDI